MRLPRRGFLQFGAAAALAAVSRPGDADTWPSRTVRLEVGLPPGGD